MKRILGIFLSFGLILSMAGCSSNTPFSESSETATQPQTNGTTASGSETEKTDATTAQTETTTEAATETEAVKTMILMIGSTEVPVVWEDNASVEELKKLAESGLSIQMSKYGGFEQVGPIGQRIPDSDKKITTSPGDIVLYSGNQIVIFYGSNTWSYTKLGKINLSKNELKELLSKGDVKISIAVR